MAKTPIITHTEILSRAISTIKAEIEDIENRGKSLAEKTGNEEMANGLVAALIEPLTPKLEALLEMYRIETGTDYV